MASIDRYRPARESYQPPSLPAKPTHPSDRQSKSPAPARRQSLAPPAVPSPPALSSRNSPPRPASSRRAAPPSPAPPPAMTSRPKRTQWLFTPDELLSTPSTTDGLRPVEERVRRAKGVSFIYQAGVLLELPQITIWVAAVFFHRFFMRVSLVEEKNGVHHYNIAATALFLANKTQEDCRKTKDLIISVARVAQKNTNLIIDEQSKEYWRWRDSILMHEEIMLEILTFDLMIEVPYQPLFDGLKRLDIHHNKRLRDAAWAYLNDSCFSMIPLMATANEIAASAIFFASASTGEKVDDVQGEPWWRNLKVDEARIARVIDVAVEFYTENPLGKKDSRYQGSPEFSLENTRRRGDTILSQLTDASSYHEGTPLGTDRGGTQSPGGVRGPNGSLAIRGEPNGGMSESNGGPVSPAVSGLASPAGTKRGSAAGPEGNREPKRARLDDDDDEDDGEIPE